MDSHRGRCPNIPTGAPPYISAPTPEMHSEGAYAVDMSAGCLQTVLLGCCRMFASMKNLLFGEDLSSDPVSRTVGLLLRFFTRGHVNINVPVFSQASVHAVAVTDRAARWGVAWPHLWGSHAEWPGGGHSVYETRL